MNKFSKIMEWAYLIFALVFLTEVVRNWNVEREKSYVSLLFVAVAVFMFIFKRRFRNKNM